MASPWQDVQQTSICVRERTNLNFTLLSTESVGMQTLEAGTFTDPERRARHAPPEAHVVQLAAQGAQAGFDVTETLSTGQLSKGHRQILVAAGEASMVCISAIAFHTLLELVGGQVIHELGEDCLSGIHPSLLTIGATSRHPAFAPGSAASNFKSKNESYTLSGVICARYSERPDFSRTLLSRG